VIVQRVQSVGHQPTVRDAVAGGVRVERIAAEEIFLVVGETVVVAVGMGVMIRVFGIKEFAVVEFAFPNVGHAIAHRVELGGGLGGGGGFFSIRGYFH
jgi:hypothetical protein